MPYLKFIVSRVAGNRMTEKEIRGREEERDSNWGYVEEETMQKEEEDKDTEEE
jgi:hypothetical protein